MKELLNTPLFGILISLLAFEIGCIISKKSRISALNPLLLSSFLIIIFLIKFHISYDEYNMGGQMISFFLGPATVILALPLYKKITLLKANALPILIGIIAGSIAGMLCVIVLSHLFGLNQSIAKSLVPKSITTPIGIEVSKEVGAIPSVTVVAIIITGILGSIIGPTICKLLGIKDKVAFGIAMGTASHAIGTAKAIEIGETEGAMSSLSIGIAGLVTVFLAPLIIKIFHSFM